VKVIGQDDNGEPIWMLTLQEYEQWKQEAAAARAGAGMQQEKNTTQSQEPARGVESQSSHQSESTAQSPQTIELGSQIWEMRKRGLSVYEIHRRLGIPMEAVKEILEQFERCFYPDVGQMMQHYAALDDARLEALIMRWLPVATGPALEVEKVGRNGRAFTELNTDTPVKAATIVLGAIKSRMQLLMACRPESVGKDGSGSTNILLWLNQVMPGIQKVVSEVESATVSRPRETLVLECEAEKLAGDVNSNGESKR
jgi:hypothetical protein